jgi:hypothetical protein
LELTYASALYKTVLSITGLSQEVFILKQNNSVMDPEVLFPKQSTIVLFFGNLLPGSEYFCSVLRVALPVP